MRRATVLAASDTNGPGLGAVPLSPIRRMVLKALFLGACTLTLLAVPAVAAASQTVGLENQVRRQLQTMKKDRQVLRFFDTHAWLLSDPRFATEAKRQLSKHRAHFALTMRRLTATRAAIEKRRREKRDLLLRASSPRAVICRVFGDYCRQAMTVAHCESRLHTGAQNGQYLGLFQMGSSERRLFGHGSSVEAQARAAYRYFVRSGRDWSPWSCKPW